MVMTPQNESAMMAAHRLGASLIPLESDRRTLKENQNCWSNPKRLRLAQWDIQGTYELIQYRYLGFEDGHLVHRFWYPRNDVHAIAMEDLFELFKERCESGEETEAFLTADLDEPRLVLIREREPDPLER